MKKHNQEKNKAINIFMKTQDVEYHTSWDLLMLVVSKINSKINVVDKNTVIGRDRLYTINYLLGGGYRHGSQESLPSLSLELPHLFDRCKMFVENHIELAHFE